ncbi:hypothetical protein ACR3K2_26260 [Cryptosporidium serpentis]
MNELSEIKKSPYKENITIRLNLDNLKTATILLMVLNITVDDYISNQYFTYFSQRLLGYIGIWLSFASTLFMYLLGRGYFFSNPFQFSYILWTSLYKYVPLLFALTFFVLPVSIYFMPEFPSWYLKLYGNVKNVYFIDFYSSYLQYMKNSLIKDNVKSQIFNRILFWGSVPFIKITTYPYAMILLESAFKIKKVRDDIKDEDKALLGYSENIMRTQNYLENLAKTSYSNYFWNIIRTISCILTTFVLFLIHIYIVEINKRRAPKVQYPVILTWSFFFIILLIILMRLLSKYFKNYKVIMKLYITTGILLVIVPCIFTYAQDNISSRHYYYTSTFLLGIWDSLFEMITGKGSLHHFSHSSIIAICFTSIFIFAIATGSRLLWLFDFINDFEIVPRMKCIGSIGMAICFYYMTITKKIKFKKRYNWIDKLKGSCALYPEISSYEIFIPSRKTLWNVLEENALLLLTFIPITTIGITTVLTKNLLFGAFESFIAVFFLSPTIWLILFNIDKIFIHVYTSLKQLQVQVFDH